MASQDAEAKKVSSILKLIEDCDKEVPDIKTNWQDSHDLFQFGSKFADKQSWQTQASLNRYKAAIRAAQGKLMSALVQGSDWWSLEPKSPHNEQAQVLRNAFEKAVNYYLEAANFKRYAATFFLNSLISMGSIYVGWKNKLVQNPEYILEKTRKSLEKEQARRAKIVANPGVVGESMPEDVLSDIQDAIEEVKSLATDAIQYKEDAIKEYVQYGCLDLQIPHFQFMWWEPNASYMEDSRWKAMGCEKSLSEIKHWAKQGYISQAKVNKIKDHPRSKDTTYEITKMRVKQTTRTQGRSDKNLIELIYYYGPLEIDGEIKKDKYFAIIANRSLILKEGEYPFWEPPGHQTPIINSAVKEIPYMATGEGIGDSAKDLQRTYDANFHLLNDTFRLGIAGANFVNVHALVDPTVIDEGMEPGKWIETREDPRKVFYREQLTTNLENQVSPVQEVIRTSIDEQTGFNDVGMGQPNLRSRTTAAETKARIEGVQSTVNTVAMDLEQNFLVPFLQKVFARFLQFGLPEINNNYELASLMTEEEMQELSQLNAGDRMTILNHYYSFQIKGFTERQNSEEILMRVNELLTTANSGGPLSQLVNLPELLRLWAKLTRLDREGNLVADNSPFAIMSMETQVLLSGHQVIPGEADDHEMHLQHQGALLNTPYATPELQQHVMMHQQALMQMQAMQQQGNGGEPVQ